VEGRELPADAPDRYREDYLIAPSISPNKKLALIYPKEGDEFGTQDEPETGDNYLVALNPFRILGPLPVGYFENINYKLLSVNWAKDSSAAVIVNGGRWSPRCVIAFEVNRGKSCTSASFRKPYPISFRWTTTNARRRISWKLLSAEAGN
jgi:hypothetical protein